MATHINNQTIKSPYSSPVISYLVSYTATRNGHDVTYNFTIKSYLPKGNSFGTGYSLKCSIGVGGVTKDISIKETTDIWNNSSGSSDKLCATDTLSVTCKSTESKENQTVTFNVTRPDGMGNSGKVSTTDYYVTSPAFATYLTVKYYSNYATECSPNAENQVSVDKNVVVKTHRFGYDNVYPSGHFDYTNVNGDAYLKRAGYNATGYWGTATDGGILVPEKPSVSMTGKTLAEELGLDISLENKEVNLYAQWKIAYNGYINVGGVVKRGLFWIKHEGTWKKGTPWIKKNGVWKRGGA